MLEHKCEICGKMWRKKLKADGKIVCGKHYSQFKRFGCFRDASPRTQRDKNRIEIVGDLAYIELYNKQYDVIALAVIDAEDVDKVKNIKWRLNCNGYVINNSDSNIFLHRRILGTDMEVDHRNGNRLNNCKSNLRVTNHSTNQMNTQHKGVSLRNDGRWYAYIKKNQRMLNLGIYAYEQEALYARWVAEQALFGEYAYPKEEPGVLDSRRPEIKAFVEQKVQRLQ